MTRIELEESITMELSNISCYQISPKEFIDIATKLGAVFPFQRNERLQELILRNNEACKSLKSTVDELVKSKGDNND